MMDAEDRDVAAGPSWLAMLAFAAIVVVIAFSIAVLVAAMFAVAP